MTSAEQLSPVKRAILELREMRARLEEAERQNSEPIAVVGMGCRFPGRTDDPAAFWRLLAGGMDAVREVPAERWDVNAYYDPEPGAVGKMSTRWGGFLEAVDQFDAEFFGISATEAAALDPQQRLLLEVAWEALEHAGQPPDRLFGTPAGVFVGISSVDYTWLQMQSDKPCDVGPYFASGFAHSAASGRLSYVLGVQGPSVSVDTACSSSLTAVHLACQSLRRRECPLALAGGVNLLLSPLGHIALSAAGMLAPDGRCKTFDARADGFTRAEGCGLIVLKRLSDARADGDRIWALIRGSAVNQDGRSSGLTAPNGPAQQAVIRAALAAAGVEVRRVQYVEAHGTGTALGDPIEMQALAAVFGQGRAADRPLRVGSVKTNLGHLESAAGVAGLIKVILALHHGEIPRHLHFREPSPHIAWHSFPVVVPTEPTPWLAGPEARVAGVSSFGFSGTNVHVIVEEAPARELEQVTDKGSDLASGGACPRRVDCPQTAGTSPAARYARLPTAAQRPLHLLALSARTEPALQELAGRYTQSLESLAETALADVCFTANAGRAHWKHRLVVTGKRPADVREALQAYRAGQTASRLQAGRMEGADPPGIAFLFSGQGSHYAGMGRQLYVTQPTFHQALTRCDEMLREYMEQSLLSLLFDEALAPLLERTEYAQPALFALEWALAEMWRSWGVEPAVVMGHSLGEYVAACVAGVFSLEDGLKLVAERGRLMQTLPAGGEMAPVLAGERDDFAAMAQGIRYAAPRVGLVANVTGEFAPGGEVANAAYWRRHARQPIQFAASIKTLQQHNYRVFLEIGPSSALLDMAARCLSAGQEVWLPSLRPGREDWQQVLTTLATLYVQGARIDWRGFDRDYPRSRLVLPTYPFQRRRHWFDTAGTGQVDHTDRQAPSSVVSAQPEDWLFEVCWRPQPEVAGISGFEGPGSWLVFAGRDSVGDKLIGLLRQKGQRCVRVSPGAEFRALGPEHYEVSPARPDDFARLMREALGEDRPPCRGVVHLWAVDELPSMEPGLSHLAQAHDRGCRGLLHLVQALARAGGAEAPRLWLVTRGAQQVGPDSGPPVVAQAPVWGLAKVIALEHPEWHCVRLDLDPMRRAGEAQALFAELGNADREPQVAFRRARRYAARLARWAPGWQSQDGVEPFAIRPDGTYLITGGLGGLGLRLSQWLTERGARHLVLMDLHDAPSSVVPVLDALRQAGVNVVVAQGDVSRVDAVRAVLGDITRSLPPLRGVIHAAGLLDDGVLLRQDWAQFARVLAPKVEGAWNLHVLTEELPLDFFVLFSAMVAVLGSAGQGSYVAANAFLDALAQHRHARGLPALAINWGVWGEIGMAAGWGLSRRDGWHGLEELSPSQGVQMLERLLHGAPAQVAVIPAQWPQLLQNRSGSVDFPFFAEMAIGKREPPGTEPVSQDQARRELSRAPLEQRRLLVSAHVQREVAKALGLPAVDPCRPLSEFGFDSLIAVRIRNALGKFVGKTLPATLAFQCPTVEAIAEYLLTTLNSSTGNGGSVLSDSSVRETSNRTGHTVPDQAQEMLQSLDQVSDTDIDAMLNTLLAKR